MSGYSCKIYIVQTAKGEVLAAKTTFTAAHHLAKTHAPARVLFAVADKSLSLNVVGHASEQADCK